MFSSQNITLAGFCMSVRTQADLELGSGQERSTHYFTMQLTGENLDMLLGWCVESSKKQNYERVASLHPQSSNVAKNFPR
jgi:hypothetical protein